MQGKIGGSFQEQYLWVKTISSREKKHKRKRNTDIVKDSEFDKSNEIFRAVLIDLKRKGLGETDHHFPFQSRICRNCTVKTLQFLTYEHSVWSIEKGVM